MRIPVRLTRLVWLVVGVALGCDESAPKDIPHLRVVAVRAEPPTAKPGEGVSLTLLSSIDTIRQGVTESANGLQIAWLGSCHNPPGGQYYDCYDSLRGAVEGYEHHVFDTSDQVLESQRGTLGLGASFWFEIPSDILESDPAYGVSFAFFAVCDGALETAPELADQVPFRCLDERGEEVGRERFALGYTTIPTVPFEANHNPELAGVSLNGVRLEGATCESDSDCPLWDGAELSWKCLAYDQSDAIAKKHCLALLERCTTSKCPLYELEAIIDPEVAEPNLLAARQDQIPKEVLTLSLETPFWRDSFDFTWEGDSFTKPPRFRFGIPGELEGERLEAWVILRDNRGGVTFEPLRFGLEPPPE